MSDYLDRIRRYAQLGQKAYSNPYAPKTSEFEQEIKPYYQQVVQEREGEPNKIRPLQMVFDLLQRGQYVSANIVDEIIHSVREDKPMPDAFRDTVVAAWQGLTGKRKGSYVNILEDYTNLEDKNIWGNEPSDKFLGKLDWADVLGFAGDVLLDPTTYIAPGATKMAKKAASMFADDAVKVAIKGMGKKLSQNAPEIAMKGFGDDFMKLVNTDPQKAIRTLQRAGGGDIAKEINDIYRTAYNKAITTPAKELQREMAESLARNMQFDQAGGLLTQNADMASKYLGAGESKIFDFFGQELGVAQRGKALGWDAVAARLGETKVGQKFKDVWWNVMNNSIVGELRQKLGFRNPYEKLLRIEELDAGENFFLSKLTDETKDILSRTEKFDDEIKGLFVQANDIAEAFSTRDSKLTIFDVLTDAEKWKEFGLTIPPEKIDKVSELAADIRSITSRWDVEFDQWVAEGIVDEKGSILNYLPSVYKDPEVSTAKAFREFGPQKQGFQKARSYTRKQTTENEVRIMKWLYGIESDQIADQLVREHNMSGMVTDLNEMLLTRAYAQSQAAKRANMVRKFREFGIPLDDLPNRAKQRLNATGAIGELGLIKLNEKGLENYVFDRAVGDILARATSLSSPKNVSMFQKAFNWYTSWWKGIVTMTPGFHARNHLSNNVTGFIKHSGKWFSPKKDAQAIAGSVYAMQKSRPKNLLKELGMEEGYYNRLLNTDVGGKTIRQHVDEQMRTGLISEAQMGFSAENMVTKVRGQADPQRFNPMSRQFVGQKASRSVGSVVENWSKFKSYLLDYEDLMGKMPVNETTMAEASKWAMLEAKKWFLDYSDLTDFERTWMKGIVPFYSWLRKNISNQISALMYYPQTFSIFPKVEELIEQTDPSYDPSLVPDWMREQGMIPVGRFDSNIMGMFRPDFPFADLNMLPFVFEEGELLPRFDASEVKNDVINAIHPVMKTAISNMTEHGYDFFRRETLDEFDDAPYVLRFILERPEVLGFLDGAVRLAGGDGLKYNMEGGKLQLPGKTVQALKDNFPLLRQLEYGILTLGTVIPGLEQAIEDATGIEDEYEKLEQIFQVLSYNTGIKIYPYDTEQSRQWQTQGDYWEAVERRNADIAQTPESQRRSQESMQLLQDRIRRVTGGF